MSKRGKQWENKTDIIYYAYNPNIAHFFIDANSEIYYTVNKSNMANLNNIEGSAQLYLGSFIVPH